MLDQYVRDVSDVAHLEDVWRGVNAVPVPRAPRKIDLHSQLDSSIPLYCLLIQTAAELPAAIGLCPHTLADS